MKPNGAQFICVWIPRLHDWSIMPLLVPSQVYRAFSIPGDLPAYKDLSSVGMEPKVVKHWNNLEVLMLPLSRDRELYIIAFWFPWNTCTGASTNEPESKNPDAINFKKVWV